MLCKFISLVGMLDILVCSFSSNIVYHNVTNISALSFSPASSLLLFCILEHSHLFPPDA